MSRVGAVPEMAGAWSETQVGDVTQLRGGSRTMSLEANDPRASGIATFPFDVDLFASRAVGSGWGNLTLTNDAGAWTGPCTGGTWDERPASLAGSSDWSSTSYAWSCWLVGSGEYAGSTYYLHLTWRGPGASPIDFHGVIYPGAPPAP